MEKKSNSVFIKVFAEATVKQEGFVCQPSSARDSKVNPYAWYLERASRGKLEVVAAHELTILCILIFNKIVVAS